MAVFGEGSICVCTWGFRRKGQSRVEIIWNNLGDYITLLHTVDIKTGMFIFLDYILLVAYLHVQYFISGHRTNLGCLPLMLSKLASQISQITKGMCQFCWTEREGWLWANCLYSGRTTGLTIISSLSATELTCCINELADSANLVWQIFSSPRFYL